jgi:LacI family transcriptional regulator
MKTISEGARAVNPKKTSLPGNITILDVARRAGVAPITVSRVVNQSGYASPATRARVESAVAALGYVPNTLARSLRSHRTHTLALVLTDITNPFFTLAARGVEDAAAEAGFTLIICNTDESEEKERRYIRMLLEKQVDGILLVPARGRIQSVRWVEAQQTPLVLLDRRLPGRPADTVRCDSAGGAFQLTRHLLEGGHRRIAMLSGPKGVSTADDRIRGYRRAMAESGLKNLAMVLRGSFTCESGAGMTRQLLALKPRPTAVFAANNFLAFGVLRALHEAGITVPEQMSLVTFDDLPANLQLEPFLSVASQPAYEMGQTATRLLLDRVLHRSLSPPREIVVPPQIIVRQSSHPL